jgi:hypothetical protein
MTDKRNTLPIAAAVLMGFGDSSDWLIDRACPSDNPGLGFLFHQH